MFDGGRTETMIKHQKDAQKEFTVRRAEFITLDPLIKPSLPLAIWVPYAQMLQANHHSFIDTDGCQH